MKTDHSTKMSAGRLRNKTGNDATAGNSVKTSSLAQNSNVTAVGKQSKRFEKTRTRRG